MTRSKFETNAKIKTTGMQVQEQDGRTGTSPGQKMSGGHTWRARSVSLSGGSAGAEPPQGPGADPLVRGVKGRGA